MNPALTVRYGPSTDTARSQTSVAVSTTATGSHPCGDRSEASGAGCQLHDRLREWHTDRHTRRAGDRHYVGQSGSCTPEHGAQLYPTQRDGEYGGNVRLQSAARHGSQRRRAKDFVSDIQPHRYSQVLDGLQVGPDQCHRAGHADDDVDTGGVGGTATIQRPRNVHCQRDVERGRPGAGGSGGVQGGHAGGWHCAPCRRSAIPPQLLRHQATWTGQLLGAEPAWAHRRAK